jgi:hypothetical protein
MVLGLIWLDSWIHGDMFVMRVIFRLRRSALMFVKWVFLFSRVFLGFNIIMHGTGLIGVLIV